MNGNLRGIFAIAILAAGCGAGGGDGGGAGGGTGGTGENPDAGIGGQGEGGQVIGGSGGAPVGGTVGGSGGEPVGGTVGGAGGEPVGGTVGGAGGEPVGGTGGAVGGAGGEPVGGTVGGAGGEPVGGSGGAGGEPVGGAGGGIVPPDACGGALDLNAGDAGDGSFVAMGNTSAAEDLFTGSCANNPGLDAVFSFTAPAAGNWVFTTEVGPDVETFDTLLYARTDCADPATEVDCDDDDAASTQSAIVVPLEAGATAFIVVDGFNLDNSGDFWLTAVPQQSLAIGDACVYEDFRTVCPENALCFSPDGNDPTCTEVVTIELGGECEPFSAVGPCAEGLFCNDIENDGTFNCAEPVIVPEGGLCQRFTPGIDCADGLICADPDEDGADTCVAPLAAAAGEPCQQFSDYFTCAEGLICGDPDFTGMDTCIEPLIVQEGSECEPFSEFIICAEPSTCLDALDDGNYTCVVVTTIDEGGACTPGDAANVCIEGASCVDLDGDGTSNCTTPTPELAACPPAYGEVAVIDTAAAAPWTIDVDTSMGVHHTNGTCGNGGDANDVALSFTAPADGEYVAQMVGDFDTVLYAREYCGFADNLACNDDSEIGGSQIFLSLVAGQTIYLIADGYNDAASGMATISIEPAAVIQ